MVGRGVAQLKKDIRTTKQEVVSGGGGSGRGCLSSHSFGMFKIGFQNISICFSHFCFYNKYKCAVKCSRVKTVLGLL